MNDWLASEIALLATTSRARNFASLLRTGRINASCTAIIGETGYRVRAINSCVERRIFLHPPNRFDASLEQLKNEPKVGWALVVPSFFFGRNEICFNRMHLHRNQTFSTASFRLERRRVTHIKTRMLMAEGSGTVNRVVRVKSFPSPPV